MINVWKTSFWCFFTHSFKTWRFHSASAMRHCLPLLCERPSKGQSQGREVRGVGGGEYCTLWQLAVANSDAVMISPSSIPPTKLEYAVVRNQATESSCTRETLRALNELHPKIPFSLLPSLLVTAMHSLYVFFFLSNICQYLLVWIYWSTCWMTTTSLNKRQVRLDCVM